MTKRKTGSFDKYIAETRAYSDGFNEGWSRAKEHFGTHEILGGGSKRYVCLDDILKFPIREDHCDKKNGSQEFINGIETVFEYIEYLPVFEIDINNIQNAYDKGWNDGFDFALYDDCE